ncbi:hypothetical protein B566_EDAN015403 [Ephemera danica]|nr:hypothetical protein B566_EDAN015403 [Ephemera danica]
MSSLMGDCRVVMPANETDVKRKQARIYLSKSALGSGGKQPPESDEEGLIPHWAIVVEFYNHGFWVEMGGVQNGGKLKGCYIKSTEKPTGTFYKFRDSSVLLPIFPAGFPDIHEIQISPNDLYRIARNHPYNNKAYNILNMRCYEWASEAANIIAEQLK